MTQHRKEEQLSTADMAAAASAQEQVSESSPREHDRERRGRDEAARDGHAGARGKAAALFSEADARELWSRWDRIQTGFVDEPRQAVEQADHLVAEVIKYLAESFAGERRNLEEQWSRGNDVSTEDLRVSLQRYRSFFDRLLSM
jgi:hypothetical protein